MCCGGQQVRSAPVSRVTTTQVSHVTTILVSHVTTIQVSHATITQVSQVMVAAILDFTRKRGFPKEDSGGVLFVVLNTSTESNYVEKHLLTFLSIK